MPMRKCSTNFRPITPEIGEEQMPLKRIKELADFFYSSDDSNEVPLRFACVTGRYTGFDLDREGFIALFTILSKSEDLKKDLAGFVEAQYDK